MNTENFEEYFRDINNAPNEASIHAKRIGNLKKLTQKLRQTLPGTDRKKHLIESTGRYEQSNSPGDSNHGNRFEIKRNNLPAIEGVSSVKPNKMGKASKEANPGGICDSCAKVGMFTWNEAMKRSFPPEIRQEHLDADFNENENGKERCVICLKFADKLNPVLPEKPVMPYTHDFYDKFSRDANSKIAKWDHEIQRQSLVAEYSGSKNAPIVARESQDKKQKIPEILESEENDTEIERKKMVGFDGKLINNLDSEKFLNGEFGMNFEDDFRGSARSSPRLQNLAPYVNDQFVMPSLDNMDKFKDIKMSTIVLQESPRKLEALSRSIKKSDVENGNVDLENSDIVDKIPELSKNVLKKLPDVQPRHKLRFNFLEDTTSKDSYHVKQSNMKQKLHRSRAMLQVNSEYIKPPKVLTPLNSYEFCPPAVPELNESQKGMRPFKKSSPNRNELSIRLEMNNRFLAENAFRDSKSFLPTPHSNMLSPLLVPDMFEYDEDFHRHRGLKGSIVKRELNPVHTKRQEMIKTKSKFTVGALGLVYDIPDFTRKRDRYSMSETGSLPPSQSPMALVPSMKTKRRPYSYV